MDPEYIPWEPGAPVVRLRRKRNKKLALLLSVGMMVLICGGVIYFGSQQQQRSSVPEQAHAQVAEPAPTQTAPGAVPPPALITRANPGQLAIVRGNVVNFFRCGTFSVLDGDIVIEQGSTDSGAIVDVSGKQGVIIECEEYIFELQ